MKLAARSKVEFLLFLCILILSFAALRPLMQTLEEKLSAVRTLVLAELEQTYNVRLSYESLSPSILRSVSLRNVKVYDAEHNLEIASFEDFSVQYRFWTLIFGNTAEVLDSVNIADGFIDIDLVENKTIAEKLKTMQQTPSSAQFSANTKQILSFFSSQLLNVHIKNVRLRFRNAVYNIDARITDGYLGIDSDAVTVSLASSAAYRNTGYTAIGQAETRFTIEGKFNKNLTSGSAVADFSHISTDRFGLYRLKLFADYRDKVFTFNTMQDFQPIDFTATWDVETNDVNGRFSCKDFIPLQSVTIYNTPKSLAQFSSLAMSGNFQFALSGRHIRWNTDLSFELPSLSFPSYRLASSQLRLEAAGDNKGIDVSRLSVSGKDVDIFSKFAFNFDTKLPVGMVSVKRFTLPSGAAAAADFQFSKKGNTFFCNIPSLTAGEGALRNIRLTVNPSTKKIDYVLSAEDEYGKYSFDGSYIYNEGGRSASNSPYFLELHGAFDAVGIGTVCNFIQAAVPKADIPQEAVASLQCTTEFYISSDLRSFSYNCIRFVLVSNTINDFYALLSLKGNQSSFALTDIELSYKNMSVRGNINADFDRLSDIIFTSSLVINSIGYQVQGFFSQNVLNIYGDYGLAISALYEKGAGFKGTVKTSEIPLPFLPLFLTIDSEFQYHNRTDWLYTIDNGYMSYGTPASLTPAKIGLNFVGKADPSGLLLPEIKLGDSEALTGTLTVTAESIADSGKNYIAAMNLVSPDADEKFELAANLNLSDEGIRTAGSFKLDNMSLARFLYTQGKTHRISAETVFSASSDTFSFRFDLPQLAMFVQGKDLHTSGSLTIENEGAELNITQLEWGTHKVSDMTGSFSLADLTGLLDVDYTGVAAKKQMKAHIHTIYAGVQPDEKAKTTLLSRLKSVTERFTVNTFLSNWHFGNFTGKEAVPLSVIRD